MDLGTLPGGTDEPPIADDADTAAALAALLEWTQAWSAKDADRYISCYSPDFVPKDVSSPEQWQTNLSMRFAKLHTVEVSTSDMVVNRVDAHLLRVSFMQNYRSDVFHDRTKKLLELSDDSGHWLIVREAAQ